MSQISREDRECALQMEVVIQAVILGVMSTVAIDIWASFSNRVLKFPRTNWGMVGRWVAHIPSGKFVHHPISSSPARKYEFIIGWAFHYVIGVIYASIYFALVVAAASNSPTLLTAWFFGLVTTLSPWFIMQPALGMGVCAVKVPKPNLVRIQNIIIHSIFGISLYYSGIGIEIFLQ